MEAVSIADLEEVNSLGENTHLKVPRLETEPTAKDEEQPDNKESDKTYITLGKIDEKSLWVGPLNRKGAHLHTPVQTKEGDTYVKIFDLKEPQDLHKYNEFLKYSFCDNPSYIILKNETHFHNGSYCALLMVQELLYLSAEV